VPATATKPPPPKDLYGPDVPYCGSFKAGYRIWVWADGTSCRTAIAVQKKLWRGKRGKDWTSVNGGSGADGYILLKGKYKGWKCTSGSGGGGCQRGSKHSYYQN
jgi:hypothetical protein